MAQPRPLCAPLQRRSPYSCTRHPSRAAWRARAGDALDEVGPSPPLEQGRAPNSKHDQRSGGEPRGRRGDVGQHQRPEALCRRRARVRLPVLPHLRWPIFMRTHRYYEWLKKGTHRIPHFTRHTDRRLMLFAGLYDSVTLDGESGRCCICTLPCVRLTCRCPPLGQSEPLWTFTIVTTAASSDYAWLHDRQPVILTSQDALDRWLDTSTQDWDPKLSRLLDPYTSTDSPLEWCVREDARSFNFY